MKVFLAGTAVSKPQEEPELCSLFKSGNKLHSFYHCVNGLETNWWNMNKNNQVNIFLDSGAFSAYTQGAEIDLDEYIQFIKDNRKSVEVYANLDVIGDARATWKNQKRMERAGLMPIPCFHFGEDWLWLERYVNNYDYIALGGIAVKKNYGVLTRWLDECFNRICDAQGVPRVKVHGFGITSLRLLFRYPWYSVDSTSWVVTSRMGLVLVPRRRSNGELDYSTEPMKVSVSNRSPSKKESGKHIETMSPRVKKGVMAYIEEKGFTLGHSTFEWKPEDHELQEGEKWSGKAERGQRLVETIVELGLSNDYRFRDQLNVMYFLDLEKSIPEYPQKFKRPLAGLGIS